MKNLPAFINRMDFLLSPELRRSEPWDLFRARILIVAIILFASSITYLAFLKISRAVDFTAWVILLPMNLLAFVIFLCWLRRTTVYGLCARYFLFWVHGLLIFLLCTTAAAASYIHIYTPCAVVISAILFGSRGALVSSLTLTTATLASFLWLFDGTQPWKGLDVKAVAQQMYALFFSSCLFMAIMALLSEYQRELSHAEQKRQRLLTIKHAQSKAAGELVGNLAHEINNPLAIMLGSAERIKRLVSTDSWRRDVDRFVTSMHKAHQRIARIHEAIATFANGNQLEPFAHYTGDKILRSVESAMNEQLQQVSIECRNHTGDIPIFCQLHQMAFVLCCLIQNSVDACRMQSDAKVIVELRCYLGNVFITVTDNGPGISPSEQGQIFQPFFTLKAGGQAQGLSLSMCRGILAAHKGDINFTSSPGETTFSCTFPIDPARKEA